MNRPLLVRQLGQQDYQPVWQAMQAFTDHRQANTTDELWLLEHPPVFTQGQAGKAEHILNPGDIPVVQIDRGGQVTYHGPGQMIAYVLFNLKELGMGVRSLVESLENCVIDLLAAYHIEAESRRDAPGVYVNDAKIAALGLRVRKGCCFHGLSLNLKPDLEPFARINPCGYKGMQITSLEKLRITISMQQLQEDFCRHLCRRLGYTYRPAEPYLPRHNPHE